MDTGYTQQPDTSSVRKDGTRVVGKIDFPPPGSGGSRPISSPVDPAFLPASRGGDETPKPLHSQDRDRTGSAVGHRTPLVDSRHKVTGQAWYGDDVRLPGELIGKILRSDRHHARIISIDTSAAESMPGVIAVATGDEYPQHFGVLPVTKDETAMAIDKVRHIGDLVACVAAVDEVTAIDALHRIVVEYEDLDAILDPTVSLSDVHEPIHDRGRYHIGSSNIQKRVFQSFGDSGAKDASIVCSGGKWIFEGVTHGMTEPHAVVAHWDPSGRLQLYSPQQVPHYVHRALSAVLKVPMHQINVIRTFVGGGFGGKSDPFPHEMCAAILARESGRPVRITFDREDVFFTNRGRHPSTLEASIGIDQEGRFRHMDIDALIDGGAFASFGHVTSYYNGVLATGPYEIGAFDYTGARVWTNRPASGAMRGHGAVNTRCAMEVAIDEAAEELAVDPIDLRLANLLPPHSRTITGFRITSIGMRECLERVRAASGWNERWRKMPLGRGLGIGCGFFISGSGLPIHWDPNKFPHATVHIQIDMDGGVTVHSGAADIGQGSTTAVAQVVAEVLGLPLDMIHVRSHESDTSPVDLGSYSSRVTFMNCNAAIQAAIEVRNRLITAAHELTGIDSDDLVVGDRRFHSSSDPSSGVSYLQALHKAQEDRGALVSSGAYRTPPMGGVHKGAAAGLAPAYSFSAYVAEVAVDVETGRTKVDKVWAAHDCGKAINPLAVEGQIIGSLHMGLGQVISETMRYSRHGQILNPDFLDYKIPSIHEMPEVHPIIVESCDPEGPFGAKEAGEGPLLPILPAVVNAIHDAVGVRPRRLPVTPDRLHTLIERRRRSLDLKQSTDLPSPSFEGGDLAAELAERARVHADRDEARLHEVNPSPYTNGVLFGFDADRPISEQTEAWHARTEPTEQDLSSRTGLAAEAWKHVEQRHLDDQELAEHLALRASVKEAAGRGRSVIGMNDDHKGVGQ